MVEERGEGAEQPARRLLELRIHGVSGTPTEQMLDQPAVRQVAGDAQAGFWRPIVEPVPPTTPGARPRVLEGYRWGGITSRAALRALWVLLAPFALVNMAAAMHQPGLRAPQEHRAIARGLEGALVRVFALSLTLMFVLAAFVIGVDLVGWQCGNTPACKNEHDSMGFLKWSWLDTPGGRVALLAAIPLAVVALLWYLSHKTVKRYEGYPPKTDADEVQSGPPPHLEPSEQTPFDNPSFWDGRERVIGLRRPHLAASFAFVALLVAYVLVDARPANTSGVWPWVLFACAAAILGISIGLVWVTPTARTTALGAVVLVLAAASVVSALTYVACADLDAVPHQQLPGTPSAVSGLFVAHLVLLALLGVAVWGRRHVPGAPKLPAAFRGFGAGCICALAMFIGAVFSAGAILRVADFLGNVRARGEIDEAARHTVVIPDAITWAARGVTFASILLVLHLVWTAFRVHCERKHDRTLPPDKKLARMIVLARLPSRTEAVIGPVLLIAFVFALLSAAVAFAADLGHELLPGSIGDWKDWSADIGSWIVATVAAGFTALMYRAYRSEKVRRVVGILWDLATFWPRSAHPLAPPCYAERTVPEYAMRVDYTAFGDPDYPEHDDQVYDVIVSAHSQGSVIAAAALLQLPSTEHIALATYGSPLRRLYRNFFPTYFGDATLAALRNRLHHRWRNLYRLTDPIGEPVGDGSSDWTEVDIQVQCPPPPRHPFDTVPAKIEIHSNYPREPEYVAAVEVLDLLLQP